MSLARQGLPEGLAMKRVCAVALLALSGPLCHTDARGGDISPPTGTVEGTMKSLEAIEPRICINDLAASPDSMHTISQPGHYYLRADVSVTSGRFGIGIETPANPLGRIVIDLNGFSIIGEPGSLDGVRHAAPAPSGGAIVIRGGRIVGCGGHGLLLQNCDDIELSDLRVSRCTQDGLHVQGARSVRICDWRDDDCDGDGIEIVAGPAIPTQVRLERCVSSSAAGDGIRVLGGGQCWSGQCRVTGAGGDGMDLDCDSIELRECATNSNAQCGVRLKGRKDMLQWFHESSDNGWQGALLLPALGSVQEKARQKGCSSHRNGFGMPGGGAGVECAGVSSVVLEDVQCSGNAGSGVIVADMDRDGRLDRVTCSSNGGHGVHVTSNAGQSGGRLHVQQVICDGNTSNGLFLEGTSGGEVVGCLATSNGGTGIFVIGSGHVVRSNTAATNSGAAIIVSAPGNVVGPLVDELSISGNSNPAANYVN